MELFDTPEEASANLDIRRNEALNRIHKRGWKVILDDSFVGRSFVDDSKWTAYLLITTDELLRDLMKL